MFMNWRNAKNGSKLLLIARKRKTSKIDQWNFVKKFGIIVIDRSYLYIYRANFLKRKKATYLQGRNSSRKLLWITWNISCQILHMNPWKEHLLCNILWKKIFPSFTLGREGWRIISNYWNVWSDEIFRGNTRDWYSMYSYWNGANNQR